MGGMQVLQWAASYPERVFAAVPIATAARHSAQNIAFHEVGRQAIMADPDWRRRRLPRGTGPGPSAASPSRAWRRTSPISRSRRCTASSAATCRTGRASPTASTPTSRSRIICATRASTFVERFDANSYLYITRACDYFDLAAEHGGVLANAFRGTHDAVLRHLLHQRLALSHQRKAAPSSMRSTPPPPMSASSRSRPTRATTRSCSRSRSSSRRCSGFLDGCAEHRGLDAAVSRRSARRRRSPAVARLRGDLRLVASMIDSRVRACSTSAAATASSSPILTHERGVDGRGMEL